MLKYKKIDASEGIDVNKTSVSKECKLCSHWFFKDVGFKFAEHVCSRCHDILTMAHSLKKKQRYCVQKEILSDVY